MIDITFMQKKFNVSVAFTKFYKDVSHIYDITSLSEPERNQLNAYLDAIETIKNAGVFDIAKCALNFYRNKLTGKSLDIWNAVFIIIGHEVNSPNKVDLAYFQILLPYAEALQKNKSNIKDIVLRSVLIASYSPVSAHFENHLQNVITNTQALIRNT